MGLVCFLLCAALPSPVKALASDRRVVRVAFPEQEGMSYIGRSGKITGYNYDYLEKISEYTGWQMEYVAYPNEDGNAAVTAALQDLADGKVDLLGPLLKNAYTEENFELPENSYGTVYTTLNALVSSSLHENNIQNVKLLRVGLWAQAATRNAEVLNFLESSNLHYEVTYYPTAEEQYQALQNGEVDVISSVSLSPFENTRIIERFAPRPYYFAAPKGETELIEQLNAAIQKIDYVQSSLQDELFDRYFRDSDNSFVLTDAERTDLAELGTLEVLCIDYDAPYVYQEDGKPKGMLISILDAFSESTGVPLHYTFCATRSEANELLRSTRYDLLIGFPFTSEYCAEYGYVRSEAILESGLSYVRSLDSTKKDTIAVIKGVENWVDTSAYSKVLLYDNAKQCIAAVNSHKADAAAGDRSIMEYYIYETSSSLTTSLISGETQKVGVAVAKDRGTELMEVLNRYISSLSDTDITFYLSEGNTHPDSGSLRRYIRQYPVQATLLVVALTAFIATGIFMMRYARQMNRKNKQLQEANEVRSEFLSRMSHDIRTPMNGILGLLDIADRYADDPAQTRLYHAKIHKASEYLLSLINDVLDMNKLEDSALVLPTDTVDLHALLCDCSDLLSAKAAEKQLTILTPSARQFAPPPVRTSALYLRQVVMNVYSRPGGSILITARVLEQTADTVQCEFSVQDRGIGMSKEFQAKMFEPFTQEHSGARSEYQGTGLGLSITKRILDRMGGTIQVESEEGVGTCIRWVLTFPLDHSGGPAPAETPSATAAKASLQGLHVLAAEDNALNAEILQFMLQEGGAQVTLAENGQQELDAFAQSAPGDFDLILTDILMPVMDGNEACRRIRALDRPDAKTIPIIALSANAFSEDAQRAEAAGINAYVTKPIDPNHLEQLICSLLQGS